MQPRRYIVVQDVNAAGVTLRRGTYVWVHGPEAPGRLTIEFKGRLYPNVDGTMLAPTPVPQPSIEQLVKRDACFAGDITAFEEIYRDTQLYFAVYRCKAHGACFLEDTQTGIGWYSRFIYLGKLEDLSEGGLIRFWKRYHSLSTDLLNLDGVCGPMPPSG